MSPEFRERLKGYCGLQGIENEYGYIFWQQTTGENIEIVFVQVEERRKGHGTDLIRKMCKKIKPFHSVIVYTREENSVARTFYEHLGFKGVIVKNLYKEGNAMLYTIPFKKLKKI